MIETSARVRKSQKEQGVHLEQLNIVDSQLNQCQEMNKFVKCIEYCCLIDICVKVASFFGTSFFQEMSMNAVSGIFPLTKTVF